jgi:SAM-dependent methyltransferase
VSNLLTRAYRKTVTFDSEVRTILRFVGGACAGRPKGCRVLDVGCGYGRNLRPLQAAGFEVMGVDANPEVVKANEAAGLPCVTSAQLAGMQDAYDVILMSHVIEHFTPLDLVPFMDGYLDRLRPDGRLVIATPVLTRYFYDDFDHVKPYHPIGLMMVFGGDRAQIRYYARNQLVLEDIWMRRSPLLLVHSRGRYLRGWRARPRQVVEFASALAFRASLGWIGQPTGWVGIFRKIRSDCETAQGVGNGETAQQTTCASCGSSR